MTKIQNSRLFGTSGMRSSCSRWRASQERSAPNPHCRIENAKGWHTHTQKPVIDVSQSDFRDTPPNRQHHRWTSGLLVGEGSRIKTSTGAMRGRREPRRDLERVTWGKLPPPPSPAFWNCSHQWTKASKEAYGFTLLKRALCLHRPPVKQQRNAFEVR